MSRESLRTVLDESLEAVVLRHMTLITAGELAKICQSEAANQLSPHAHGVAWVFQQLISETGLDITDEKNEFFYLGNSDSTISIYYRNLRLAVHVSVEPDVEEGVLSATVEPFLMLMDDLKPLGAVGLWAAFTPSKNGRPWDGGAVMRILGIYSSEDTMSLTLDGLRDFLSGAKN